MPRAFVMSVEHRSRRQTTRALGAALPVMGRQEGEMPKESFYNADATQAEAADMCYASGRAFSVWWGVPVGPGLPGIVTIAGVQMDRSAVDRLIRVLKRARRKAMPDWSMPGYYDN